MTGRGTLDWRAERSSGFMCGKLFTIVAFAGAVLASGAAAQSPGENAQRCHNYQLDPDLRLGACTAIIQSGRGTAADLASAFNDRGNAYYDKGQYDRAIRDFDQALQLKPDAAEPLSNRCWVRAIVGQLAAALADCDRSLALRPGDPDTLDARGLVYLRMKEPAAAIADYDAALSRKPTIDTSFYGRGLAKRMTGDEAGAAADIAAAKQLTPNIAAQFAKWGVSGR